MPVERLVEELSARSRTGELKHDFISERIVALRRVCGSAARLAVEAGIGLRRVYAWSREDARRFRPPSLEDALRLAVLDSSRFPEQWSSGIASDMQDLPDHRAARRWVRACGFSHQDIGDDEIAALVPRVLAIAFDELTPLVREITQMFAAGRLSRLTTKWAVAARFSQEAAWEKVMDFAARYPTATMYCFTRAGKESDLYRHVTEYHSKAADAEWVRYAVAWLSPPITDRLGKAPRPNTKYFLLFQVPEGTDVDGCAGILSTPLKLLRRTLAIKYNVTDAESRVRFLVAREPTGSDYLGDVTILVHGSQFSGAIVIRPEDFWQDLADHVALREHLWQWGSISNWPGRARIKEYLEHRYFDLEDDSPSMRVMPQSADGWVEVVGVDSD